MAKTPEPLPALARGLPGYGTGMSFKIYHPKDDPIGYLCKRRYPLAYREHSFSASYAELAPYREADEKAEAYRKELEAIPHDEMMALFEAEYEKERNDYRDKLKREEQALFFHQPEVQADLSHWSKMAVWSLDEAIALSFGKDPAEVNWSSVSMRGERFLPEAWRISEFPKEYARRMQLVERAKSAGQLSERIKPEDFVRWAVNVFDSMPDELHQKFLNHAPPKISLDRYPSELRIAIEDFEAVSASPALPSAPKKALRKWLDANKPDLTNEAKERIAIVANWKPTGGAPKTPTRKGG